MKTILALLFLGVACFNAAPQTVIPATTYGASYPSYGRTVRSVYYRLTVGRVYEFQKSRDGGLTWSHSRAWFIAPEKYITPGVTANGYPWYGAHWIREEVLSQPGMYLQRCVDWTDVPIALRPSPATWLLN